MPASSRCGSVGGADRNSSTSQSQPRQQDGNSIEFEDRRFDCDEQRFITLGMLRENVVAITTAETDDEIRLISMRKAERHEEEIYYANL